jgi:hypothetical protein
MLIYIAQNLNYFYFSLIALQFSIQKYFMGLIIPNIKHGISETTLHSL